MNKVLLLLLISLSLSANTQKLLKGVVTDQVSNKPIPKASIFLNNTSIGTTSDDNGSFQLFVPEGKFELIITSIGYESNRILLTANELESALNIKMNVKAEELEAVVRALRK